MTPNAPVVTPFPYASLEALTRAEVVIAARLRRLARTHVRVEELEAALAELVTEPVQILVRRYRPLDRARGADDALGVLLAPSGARDPQQRVLVEVEGTLGAVITARALRQRAPRLTDSARNPSPALAGAFAAVVLAAMRRAHGKGAVLRVVAAGPAAVLARDLGAASPSVTTAWLTVVVGGDAYEARVSVSDSALPDDAEQRRFSAHDLLALGDARLALPLVIATTRASTHDIATLTLGDAFVPTGIAVKVQPDGSLLGGVALVAARGERGLSADLAEGGRLVVRGLVESHPWEHAMPIEDSGDDEVTTVEILEEAPIVVRVELGAVEMTAREWAGLGAGDIVTLGRKLGDPALLRVAGVEIARGELVSVDGEMAVRITARTKNARGVKP